jgi:Holliday junction resolvase RusA-like endonuclease
MTVRSIVLFLNIKARPKDRARVFIVFVWCKNKKGRIRVVDSRVNKAFAFQLRKLVREEIGKGHQLFKGPLTVRVDFHFHHREPRYYHAQRPDIDNLLKAVMDVMNGLVWSDDCQIDALTASKKFTQGNDYIYLWVSEYGTAPNG